MQEKDERAHRTRAGVNNSINGNSDNAHVDGFRGVQNDVGHSLSQNNDARNRHDSDNIHHIHSDPHHTRGTHTYNPRLQDGQIFPADGRRVGQQGYDEHAYPSFDQRAYADDDFAYPPEGYAVYPAEGYAQQAYYPQGYADGRYADSEYGYAGEY